MPVSLKNATVAIEDQRFYTTARSTSRASSAPALKNVFSGGTREGGSTITQQLATDALHPRPAPEPGAARFARRRSRCSSKTRHSKQWILWQYLNSVPYGAVNGRSLIGVEAAAQAFFSKPAKR